MPGDGDGGRRGDTASAGLALPPLDAWLGAPMRLALDAARLKPGLNVIEADCPAPCFVTAHIRLADATLALVVAPLEVVAPGRACATIALTGPASEAWLDVLPGDASAIPTARIGPVPLTALAGQAWRAALRHAGSPLTLLAKARQVAGGHGNLVLSSGLAAAGDADACYARWQTAFESVAQRERLLALADRHLGPGDIRVLAVVAPGMSDAAVAEQVASLEATRRARVRVIDQRAAPATVLAGLRDVPPETLVLVLDTPGRFQGLAVTCLALALALQPSSVAAYGDCDRLGSDGVRRAPQFKPAWSPDYQAASDYVGQPVAFRALPDLLAQLPDAATGRLSARLLDAATAQRPAGSAVAHVPRVLFHGHEPATEPVARRRAGPVVPALSGDVLVSVIIPTKENPDLLARACRSVQAAQGVRAEIVIVDNGAQSGVQKALLACLAATGDARVVADHGDFNFSRLINAGRAAARGDVLVSMNDDIEAIDGDWLAELTRCALRPGIGAVGALLLYPDGRVQHAGVLLGINGGAGHALRFAVADAPDADPRLTTPREVAAVTAACLAVSRRNFDAVSGFGEDLPVTLNDVDFCLKLHRLGLRNVVWPAVRLIHRESTTRGLDATPEKLARLAHETAVFQRKWGEAAMRDPYLSPHLSPSHEDFRPRRM